MCVALSIGSPTTMFADFSFKSIEKLVLHSLFDKQARAGATHLALVEEDSHHRAADRLLDVSIGKHDVWRFAAEFERNLRQVFRRCFARSALPTSVEPVNATLSMPGCAASAAPAVSP